MNERKETKERFKTWLRSISWYSSTEDSVLANSRNGFRGVSAVSMLNNTDVWSSAYNS
jgi:hypothetical protein